MCGRAMFTIVPSSTTISWAPPMTARAMPRPRGRARPGLWSGGDVPRRGRRRSRTWRAFRGQGRVDVSVDGRGYAVGRGAGPARERRVARHAGRTTLVHDRGDVGTWQSGRRRTAWWTQMAGSDRGQQVEVGVRADLAALLGAVEAADAPGRAWARGSAPGTRRTARRRGASPARGRPSSGGRPSQRPRPGRTPGEQVAAQRAGVAAAARGPRADAGGHGLHDEVGLGGPAR